MVAALLVACSLYAGSPAEPAPPGPPTSTVFTTESIDRAIKRVDVQEELAWHLALHPDSPLPGTLPSYSALITVEDRMDRLTPTIEEYEAWPGLDWGGHQSFLFQHMTGIPWWF